MASRKRSVWTVLERLGHKGDRDDTIQHVFEKTSRVTLHSDDGAPIDGDDYLVSVFESLGTTKNWPGCGSSEWVRLRQVALQKVVARLARDGLLDAIAVGCATDDEVDTDTAVAKDESPDPRVGVQVFRAYIRRGQRNPNGWFTGIDRNTPYKVIARWASEACPGVPTESLVALLDALREVRWWDDDGHVIGGEMLRTLEAELEEGCGHEMLVVSDFERAIQRLRSVFERLSLL